MVKIRNIVWDTESDGEVIPQDDLGLPTNIDIDDDDIESLEPDDITEWLSDKYGYCVSSYDLCQVPYQRALELINAFIDHISVAENTATVIEELSNLGFTKNELAFFNFTDSDIEEYYDNSDEEE